MKCDKKDDLWAVRWRPQFETFSPREMSLDGSPIRRNNSPKWDFSSNFIPPTKEMIDVTILLGMNHKRFGFSVVGGRGEGLKPRIDEIQPGSVKSII